MKLILLLFIPCVLGLKIFSKFNIKELINKKIENLENSAKCSIILIENNFDNRPDFLLFKTIVIIAAFECFSYGHIMNLLNSNIDISKDFNFIYN